MQLSLIFLQQYSTDQDLVRNGCGTKEKSAVISLLQKCQKSCDCFFLMRRRIMLLLQHSCMWKIICQIFNLCWITTLGL